ncbi:MAG: TolB family protein [Fimbriimonas sp.]
MLNPTAPPYINTCSPSVSGNGTQIVSSEYDSPTNSDLYVTNTDGSGRVQITNGTNAITPNWSPVSSKIVYSQGGDIWVINSNGTGATRLTTTTEIELQPKWNAAGTKIGYLRAVGFAYHFWEMDANGANQTSKISTAGTISSWDYDPTGNEIVAIAGYPNRQIMRQSLVSGANLTLVPPSGDYLEGVTWSPQGSHIAYVRDGGGYARIESMRLNDRATLNVRTLSSSSLEASPEWGPLVRRRPFIAATGGVIGTNAAGFLYGMVRSEFASFLAFDAVTRNSVDIDVPPPSGIDPTNFFATITAADTINMLRYANGFSTPRITVVDPSLPSGYIQGAVVSFDASNGKVAAVLPFNRSRSGEKPTRTEQGDRVTYRGDFIGIWDGEGMKSDAPTTEVTMDLRTGKVISHN